MSSFRKSIDFSSRELEAATICKYWPDKIPVILEKDPKSKMNILDKPKFLCPNDFSVTQFMVYLRKKINLPRKAALFIMIERGEMLSGDKMMMDIYQRYKNEDGFLYLIYGEHPAYG